METTGLGLLGGGPFGVFVAVMALYLVAAVTPGPNLLATLRASLASGRGAGLAVVTGITLASMIWALASLLGISLVFAMAPWLYGLLLTLGALYLIWMGANLLYSAWRPTRAPVALPLRTRASGWWGVRHGLLVTLSNPKSAVFYSSLFAVSVPLDAPDALRVALVAAVGLVAFAWYGGMALLVSLPPFAQAYRRGERALTAVSGAIFLGFGIKLLSQRA